MIGTIFKLGSQTVEVRVHQDQILFRSSEFRSWATIDGLRLNKAGVIKEFPDLQGEPLWESKARSRFKEKIKTFSTEKKRMIYIIDELKKFGYLPLIMQEQGFRPKRLI